MDSHVLNAYRGYAVNHKSGVCKSTDPNTKLENSNSLAAVLYYFDVYLIDSIYPFGYLTEF